jgi:transcriptional regulator with XRE-family HTH domain
VLAAAGCADRGRKTADELRETIAAYERGEASATEERIAALFKRLDAEVATLEAEELEKPPADRAEVAARREALAAERRELQTAYVGARVARLGVAADEALKGLGEQIGQGLEEAGRAIRDSMRREGAP